MKLEKKRELQRERERDRERQTDRQRDRERVSFTSARMYIVARKEIMKCVFVFLGLNVERKA